MEGIRMRNKGRERKGKRVGQAKGRDKERYREKDGTDTYEKGQSQKWDWKATRM